MHADEGRCQLAQVLHYREGPKLLLPGHVAGSLGAWALSQVQHAPCREL